MKQCKHCGCDIEVKNQICIPSKYDNLGRAVLDKRPEGQFWCESDTIWIGYEFLSNIGDERHRFAQELRAAHLTVIEIGPVVLCDSEDVVQADSIRRVCFGDFASKVKGYAARYSDHNLQELENKYKDWKDGDAPQP